MTDFWNLSPLRFFDFYLVLLFVASVVRRMDWYRSVVGIIWRVPGRWPNLFKLVKEHRMILLTFRTILPALLALGLSIIQLIASRLIWPEASRPPGGLTFASLWEHWWAVVVTLPLGIAMVCLDIYGIIMVGQVDRALLEKYFDQAEYWLRSKTAHVVRFFTLGFVNPRRIVATEVQKALVDATQQLNFTLWWITMQVALRIAFGLSLWLSWAIIFHL